MHDLESTLEHLHQRVANGDDVIHLIKEQEINWSLSTTTQQKVHAFGAGNCGLRKVKLPLTFFFQQEKVQASRRLFTGIRNAKGTIVRSISAILRVLLHFLCATFYCLHFIILGSVSFCQLKVVFFVF
jgi:hypothetical protein